MARTDAKKSALRSIRETGEAPGARRVTLESLEKRGHIKARGSGWEITKRGTAFLEGRLGGGNLAHRPTFGAGGFQAPKTRKGGVKHARGFNPKLAQERAAKRREREALAERRALEAPALRRILGTRGKAYAVKIAPADGGLINRLDGDAFQAEGWRVMNAGTAPAKAGTALPGARRTAASFPEEPEGQGDAWEPFWNPDPFGPEGEARAVVLARSKPIREADLDALRARGYDLSPAPKRYREAATVKNPKTATPKARLLALMIHAEAEGHAHTAGELAKAAKMTPSATKAALESMEKAGQVYRFKRHWRPKVANPPGDAYGEQKAAARKAAKKASDWYGKDALVTPPRRLKGFEFPDAFVEVGEITAIEYESKKFDGKKRIYRHDVTGKRKLLISVDGSTMIVSPSFKITKRGIEG